MGETELREAAPRLRQGGGEGEEREPGEREGGRRADEHYWEMGRGRGGSGREVFSVLFPSFSEAERRQDGAD